MSNPTHIEYTEYIGKCGEERIKILPEGWSFPKNYLNYAEQYRNFHVRSDDIWILGFPRSGTTMIQALIWAIQNDYQKQDASITFDKVFFFESQSFTGTISLDNVKPSYNEIVNNQIKNMQNTLSMMENQKTKRTIKAHTCFRLLPNELLTNPDVKMIYVARNPKDVIVSFYNFAGAMIYSNIEEYFDDFEKAAGSINFAPYFEHIKQAWEKRHLKNIYFLYYEDVKKDLRGTIEKLGHFLGKDLSNEQITNIEKLVEFKNFKEGYDKCQKDMETAGYPIIRGSLVKTGKTNGWKEAFSSEFNARVEKWIQKYLSEIPGYKIPESD